VYEVFIEEIDFPNKVTSKLPNLVIFEKLFTSKVEYDEIDALYNHVET